MNARFIPANADMGEAGDGLLRAMRLARAKLRAALETKPRAALFREFVEDAARTLEQAEAELNAAASRARPTDD